MNQENTHFERLRLSIDYYMNIYLNVLHEQQTEEDFRFTQLQYRNHLQGMSDLINTLSESKGGIKRIITVKERRSLEAYIKEFIEVFMREYWKGGSENSAG